MNVLFLCLRQICVDRGLSTVWRFIPVGLTNIYKHDKIKTNKIRCLKWDTPKCF